MAHTWSGVTLGLHRYRAVTPAVIASTMVDTIEPLRMAHTASRHMPAMARIMTIGPRYQSNHRSVSSAYVLSGDSGRPPARCSAATVKEVTLTCVALGPAGRRAQAPVRPTATTQHAATLNWRRCSLTQ